MGRLHIVSDASDDFSAYERITQPHAYSLLEQEAHPSSPKEQFYINPFRIQDISCFPEDLQVRLSQFPLTKQIAILKNPRLQQEYFPEYCQPSSN